ncbi:MAG TPA: sigma-70 family RNA polymerase sigma factor [Polyangiaceae bacterium]|jgi:RNA polymerase sigma-32 factor|nr:sigma-70 family RNA polymerase sigma factor [Polyangiaceae bacterium]
MPSTAVTRSRASLELPEEQELVQRMIAGSSEALMHLIDAHMPLVRTFVRRYYRDGLSGDDLAAEGRLGLLVAAQRFDPHRGVRFGRYAAWWVRAMVRRHALRNRRIVAPPAARQAAMNTRDAPVATDGGLYDLADMTPSPEELLEAAERRLILESNVRRAMGKLPDRERAIVSRRLLEDDKVTLESLGRDIGVSRERVRQLEERAKGQLRRALEGVA